MNRRTITIAMILTTFVCLGAAASATAPATVTYTLDASRSKFMAHASPSGLLWFKGHEMKAVGKFSIDRDDYKVKATSAFHGMVRVSNTVKFEFDIVGKRQ